MLALAFGNFELCVESRLAEPDGSFKQAGCLRKLALPFKQMSDNQKTIQMKRRSLQQLN